MLGKAKSALSELMLLVRDKLVGDTAKCPNCGKRNKCNYTGFMPLGRKQIYLCDNCGKVYTREICTIDIEY